MTFSQYARARRLALAQSQLASGDKVIEAQITAGYESASGFRAAFANTFGVAPKNTGEEPLRVEWIDTPVGPMVAVCDAGALYLLEFTDRKALPKQFTRLSKVHGRAIIPGRTNPTGTDFQKLTWQRLLDIPYGQTWSYAQLADAVGNSKAVRAVAASLWCESCPQPVYNRKISVGDDRASAPLPLRA